MIQNFYLIIVKREAKTSETIVKFSLMMLSWFSIISLFIFVATGKREIKQDRIEGQISEDQRRRTLLDLTSLSEGCSIFPVSEEI